MEIVEALLSEELRRSIIKIRIELMDYALEAQSGEETGRKSCKMITMKNAPLNQTFENTNLHKIAASTRIPSFTKLSCFSKFIRNEVAGFAVLIFVVVFTIFFTRCLRDKLKFFEVISTFWRQCVTLLAIQSLFETD